MADAQLQDLNRKETQRARKVSQRLEVIDHSPNPILQAQNLKVNNQSQSAIR
jgi:hypothetical protein